MANLCKKSLILTNSSLKQLGMICKINEPFKMVQFVFRKGIKVKFIESFREKVEESGSLYFFISREYDGSERFVLLYPSGFSYDFFPSDDNLIWLV